MLYTNPSGSLVFGAFERKSPQGFSNDNLRDFKVSLV